MEYIATYNLLHMKTMANSILLYYMSCHSAGQNMSKFITFKTILNLKLIAFRSTNVADKLAASDELRHIVMATEESLAFPLVLLFTRTIVLFLIFVRETTSHGVHHTSCNYHTSLFHTFSEVC